MTKFPGKEHVSFCAAFAMINFSSVFHVWSCGVTIWRARCCQTIVTATATATSGKMYTKYLPEKTLEEAKEDLEDCVCDTLEKEIGDRQLGDLRSLLLALGRLPLPRGRRPLIIAIFRDFQELQTWLRQELRRKPDDLCDLTDWTKNVLERLRDKYDNFSKLY